MVGRLAVFLVLVVSSLSADDVVFGVRPVAPYVVAGPGGQFSGLEYEILAAALEVRGHRVRPTPMPLARLLQSFRTGLLPAAAPVLARHNTGGILSAPYLTYKNIALALASSKLHLPTVGALKGLSIAAFQTAKNVLGPEFTAAVEGNRDYVEEAQQITQIRLLFSGRVEVIVGDSRILHQLIRSPEAAIDTSQPTVEYDLFAPTPYSAAFWDPGLAQDFDLGLATLQATGAYQKILDRYP